MKKEPARTFVPSWCTRREDATGEDVARDDANAKEARSLPSDDANAKEARSPPSEDLSCPQLRDFPKPSGGPGAALRAPASGEPRDVVRHAEFSAPQRALVFRQRGVVTAFVVNVYNPLNFDLDLAQLPQYLLRNASFQRYTYVDDESDRYNLYRFVDSRSYRCRIRHLTKSENCTQAQFRNILKHIVRRIDALDGWVHARVLSGENSQRLSFDKYGRILVDIYDPYTGENLGEWIVKQFPNIIRIYQNRSSEGEPVEF